MTNDSIDAKGTRTKALGARARALGTKAQDLLCQWMLGVWEL